jgi:hypothetical protein
MDAPYGDPAQELIREAVITDSKLAVRVAALCKIHHAVGDAFSIEHVFPTPMLQFQSYQKLLNMPGVFVFTWDNCRFGEKYQHRQVLVTNQPYLAVLAKDCPNTRTNKVHDHLTIGFDKDLRTSDVSAYSRGWCRAYAKAFRESVDEPVDKRCVHCLPQGDSRMIYNRREAVRRCAEVVGLQDRVMVYVAVSAKIAEKCSC